jgi:hypothetical protein
LKASYLVWIVPNGKIATLPAAAGYDESDSISSMDGTDLPLAPSPPRLYRILKFITMTNPIILSVPVVPTLTEDWIDPELGSLSYLSHIPEATELENRICGEVKPFVY